MHIFNSDKVSFLSVDAGHSGQRLDNFLIKHLKGVPKSRLYRLIRKGEIRINKRRVRASCRVCDGDVLRIAPIRVSENHPKRVVDQNRRLNFHKQIVYEDDAIIVLNKPSGIAVHGGSGVSFGVIESLREMRPEQKYMELVHRLDRDTSGCLLLAKKRSALIKMQYQLKECGMTKSYLALVKGIWPITKKIISAPLLKNKLLSGERVVRVDGGGKESITHFSVIKQFKNCTLLKVELVTGRTHQIRVHCQYAGYPIAGDLKYGEKSFNTEMRALGLKRLFLHADKIKLRHPITGIFLEQTAKIPQILKETLQQL